MMMENLQNSPDVDDCAGSVHTLLLETSVTPMIDQPAPTLASTNPLATISSSTPNSKRFSPPRRQYSSESNDSPTSPEKTTQQKQQSSVTHQSQYYNYHQNHHHPQTQLNTTYTISPDISTSSLISASEHYNGESLLQDNICSPQTSNSSPDTPEWSLIDSFHKHTTTKATATNNNNNGDISSRLQNGNNCSSISPNKRPLLFSQEKDEIEETGANNDYDEPFHKGGIDSEDSINNKGNKVIITIGSSKSGSPVSNEAFDSSPREDIINSNTTSPKKQSPKINNFKY